MSLIHKALNLNNFNTIQLKLEAFIKKYYTSKLIKGLILFFALGLIYFLATLLIEYALWLSPRARTFLFWTFVGVELILLLRLVAFPVAQLFKLKKGINYEEASKIIGSHFPKVNDKLLNVLQLSKDRSKSELLLASIEQKSKEIKSIPFKLAVNFRQNLKYLKYAAIPVLIVALTLITGRFSWLSDGYERVVNYRMAFEPPAPFQFFITNENLQAVENEDFKLVVSTEGEFVPENVQITYNNETYFLKQRETGEFEYVFSQLNSNVNFNLSANNVTSRSYAINVLEVPTLLDFNMILDYPNHTKKKDETLINTGNTIVPQGTKITWKLKTKATDEVFLYAKDTLSFQSKDNGEFEASRRINNDFGYSLNTSNTNLKDYESLSFFIDVVRDEYPILDVQMALDSIDNQTLYFLGRVSDDYGLSKLQLVYYPSDSKEETQIETIPVSTSNFDEFVDIFPDQLMLDEGISYDLYYEVFDNDAIHNFKSTKSETFSYRKLTKDEIEQNLLKEQGDNIDDINNALEKFNEQEKRLKELSRTQKEKPELSFNDKRKLEDFLKRQKKQEEMMKNFNRKLKENLENFRNEHNEKDRFKEDLKQRLEENQEQLQEDEKLLEELLKLAQKIQKEELAQKLEELAKQNKNKKRSLKQLLELTKRYYVAQKMEKLRMELEELSKEQEKLSEETIENNTKENQDVLNEKFKDFQKELNELRKENKGLIEPLNVPQDKKGEEDIKKEQQEASDNLEKKDKQENSNDNNSQEDAKKNQKKAAQKMMQMSKKMEQMSAGSSGNQIAEDIDMLRQILDNLILFSFEQEELMNQFRNIQINHNEYPKYLRKQQSLREHFEHVDDSLFALSLRQPMISEPINKEISEIYFNIDKSLNQFAENRLYQGVAAQQFAVTSTNTLASLLSDLLDNLEQMSMAPGKGGKGEMQLPDIIMSQEELNEQMKEGLDKSGEGNEKKGDNNGEKEGEQNGEKDGEQSGDGEGSQEELNGELFRIYQQQQMLRQALEDKLGKEGIQGIGSNLLRKMEEIEQDLLNKGFTNRTLEKMMQLQHQLLKLENATFQQGEDNKRKSRTNTEQFNNTTAIQLERARKYFNTTEILNRQTLPLQQVYKKKVKDYFKQNND